MTRDFQRGKVYSAEQRLIDLLDQAAKRGLTTLSMAGSTVPVPVERKFGDLAAIQRYVDLVLARTAEQYGVTARVTVRERRGNAKAHYEHQDCVIAIPPHQPGLRAADRSWAMRELVILHEIAHHLTRRAAVAHGPQFVAAFLDLVERFIGAEAAFLLRVLAHESGLKIG